MEEKSEDDQVRIISLLSELDEALYIDYEGQRAIDIEKELIKEGGAVKEKVDILKASYWNFHTMKIINNVSMKADRMLETEDFLRAFKAYRATCNLKGLIVMQPSESSSELRGNTVVLANNYKEIATYDLTTSKIVIV